MSDGLQQWGKSEHLARMQASGFFRHVKEVVVHHIDSGNAERLVGVLLSQGSTMGLLKQGMTEHDLDIDYLRAVASRTLGTSPKTWYWSSRIRLGVV